MPAFGGGLTLCSHLVRWGERVTPLGTTDAELPPCTRTALEMVNEIRARKHAHDTLRTRVDGAALCRGDVSSCNVPAGQSLAPPARD